MFEWVSVIFWQTALERERRSASRDGEQMDGRAHARSPRESQDEAAKQPAWGQQAEAEGARGAGRRATAGHSPWPAVAVLQPEAGLLLADPLPARFPPLVADRIAYGQHGIDMLRLKSHASAFETGLDHESVGTFDHARANGPSLLGCPTAFCKEKVSEKYLDEMGGIGIFIRVVEYSLFSVSHLPPSAGGFETRARTQAGRLLMWLRNVA